MALDGVAGDVSHVSNNSYEPGSDGNGVTTAFMNGNAVD